MTREVAQGETNAEVNAIKGQQQVYAQQGQRQAQNINAAYQAAANLLAGLNLGGATATSYDNAAKTIGALASGFSGQTGADATSAANEVRANLADLGAPVGSLKTATGQTTQPAALQNVLYGLGGFIPGNLLETAGQAQAAQQRALPASLLDQGAQQASGVLAAAQAKADTLIPNIVNARANEPTLLQTLLSNIASQANTAALDQSLIGSRANASQVQDYNAQTGRIKASNTVSEFQTRESSPSASLSAKYGYVVDSRGNAILDANGHRTLLPGYTVDKQGRVVKAAATRPLTTAQRAKYRGQAILGATTALSNGYTYQQAVNAAREAGIPDSVALPQINKTYKVNASPSAAIDTLTANHVPVTGPAPTPRQKAINSTLFPNLAPWNK